MPKRPPIPSTIRHPRPKPTPQPPTYTHQRVHKISTILRTQPWSTALQSLQTLKLDSFTTNAVLKTHPPLEKSFLFFKWATTKARVKPDHFTYTTLLDILGEAGRLDSMRHLFREMEENDIRIDAATYTVLLNWLGRHGDLEGAVGAWEEMRRRGCSPTVVSYTAFMKVLFDCGRGEEAAGIYREMLRVGLVPNCRTYTVLIEFLAGNGKFKAALEIMEKMQEAGIEPDKATCNILVDKFSKAGETSAMRHILLYMKDHSIVLRHQVYLQALEALRNNNECDDLLREVNPHLASEGIKNDLDNEVSRADTRFLHDRAIIVHLLSRKNYIAIEKLLKEMVDKEIQLDSQVLSLIVQASCIDSWPSCALTAFNYCLGMKKEVDKFAYTSLIGFFIRSNNLQMVVEIVDKLIRAGVTIGTYLASLLINKLGSAGLCSSAEHIFFSLPRDQNLVTCTALMNAFFLAGEVDKAHELYLKMKAQGLPMSSGAYEVLILGLERAGRTYDADLFRKEKRKFQWGKYPQEGVSLDEKLCDSLFDGH